MSNDMLANALGSAAAGIISRTFTHPLDTAKARLQNVYQTTGQRQNPFRGPFDVLVKTARTEGISGLYRGYGAVIVGGTPATVLYLCTYEIAKERLSQLLAEESSGSDFLVHFSAGMIAETISCIVFVPVDVIKERMQVQRLNADGTKAAGAYRNSWDALKQIARTEGISGIYRGYFATLGSFGPFSALYFVFYEKFKHWTRQYLTGRTDESSRALDKVDIPFQWVLLCSASAGALASWLTSPLDLAKLRLQVQRGNLSSNARPAATTHYRGVADCLRQTFSEGGLRGLFRGAGARVLHFAPATTITMTSYETCRSLVSKLFSD